MEYAEARKLAQADKPKENYLQVKVDYNTWLVFPYKEGLAFLGALANAQEIKENYSAPPYMGPLQQADRFAANPLSAKDLERYKIASLLGVSMGDLARAEKQAAQSTQPPSP